KPEHLPPPSSIAARTRARDAKAGRTLLRPTPTQFPPSSTPLTLSPLYNLFPVDSSLPSSSPLSSPPSFSDSLATDLCLLQTLDWCSIALSRLTRRTGAASFATDEFARGFLM